ncbi:hypothetical protein METHB2_670009 [Candidatus Methylobacter favarea]|uniref:Uncharacterized protein n=1 Tax=Candidatus Methylobacter favarea TaxID=2707345 RepID=A0A8S0WCA7_9GAMM|nr:hypothetical protein METHB2_670009 [Candidatus Methylobacter favarea]
MFENQSAPAFPGRKTVQYLVVIIITPIAGELVKSIPLF